MLKLFAALSLKRSKAFYNYFDDSTKLFSELYLAKFLDISAKPCIIVVTFNCCSF